LPLIGALLDWQRPVFHRQTGRPTLGAPVMDGRADLQDITG
jgi:hypothetical protein